MAHSPIRLTTQTTLIFALALALLGHLGVAAGEERTTPPSPLREYSPNDLRISDMGANDGSSAYDGFHPAVAYDPTRHQQLVVWDGDDDTAPLVNGEFEIFGQLLSFEGQEIGTDFRISQMGTNGDSNADARSPAVAFNSSDDEYLVVWEADPNAVYGNLVANGELEIFGQLVAGGTGASIGADFRISTTGPDGSEDFDASKAAVAFSSVGRLYLVVWQCDPGSPLAPGKQEIFGQLIAGATGAEIGTDFRISFTGSDTNNSVGAAYSAVAYNAAENLFLVTWQADDTDSGLVNDEFEIFAQFLDGTSGAAVGDVVRVSDMGPDATTAFQAMDPSVASNTADDQMLIVWAGDDDAGTINDETEIFGQLIDVATKAEVGGDFRISAAGPEGDTGVQAVHPAVAYDTLKNTYQIVWEADDSLFGLANDEFEIFAQQLQADGTLMDASARLSDMGQDGNPAFNALDPAVVFVPRTGLLLAVWAGDDPTGDLSDGEFEIYGQRFGGTLLFADDFETGDTSRWSPVVD